MQHRRSAKVAAVMAKIGNSENMNVPFMWYSSGTACGGVTDMFLPNGMIHAAAAWPPQRKVGLVCIPTRFFLRWTCINSRQSSQNAGNRDEGRLWKKLNSSCNSCKRLWQTPSETFALWYCAPQSGAFFWIWKQRILILMQHYVYLNYDVPKTRKSVPRSSRQLDCTKTSWPL